MFLLANSYKCYNIADSVIASGNFSGSYNAASLRISFGIILSIKSSNEFAYTVANISFTYYVSEPIKRGS